MRRDGRAKWIRGVVEQGYRARDFRRRLYTCTQPELLLLIGAIGYFVFYGLGQTREAMLALAEAWVDGDGVGPLAATALILGLFSALFGVAFEFFSERAVEDVEQSDIGAPLRWVRQTVRVIFMAAPWVWAMLGAFGAHELIDAHGAIIDAAQDLAAIQALDGLAPDRLDALRQFLIKAAGAAALGAGASVVLLRYVLRPRRRAIVIVLLAVAIAAFVIGPAAAPEAFYGLFRGAGPLAASASALFSSLLTLLALAWIRLRLQQPFYLVLLVVAGVVIGAQVNLGALLGASGVVVLGVLVALLIGFTVYGIGLGPRSAGAWSLIVAAVFVSWASDLQPPSPGEPVSIAGGAEPIAAQFESWRKARDLDADAPFPVFVIAARGGGAYAAASTAALLARLECLSPGFSQHVFAISGVSGGSVGATLFNDLLRSQALRAAQSRDCAPGGTRPPLAPLERNALGAVTENHVGVAVAAFPVDFLRKIIGRAIGRDEWSFSRFRVLIRSFLDARNRAQELAWSGGAAAGASASATEPAPLNLVLNTTWSETGYRVAFSPFDLGAFGRGALYRFEELEARGKLAKEGEPCSEMATPHGLLLDGRGAEDGRFAGEMRDALASATFPVVLPSFARCKAKRPGADPDERPEIWNFVDGGYSDSSGATTAADIFEALHALRAEAGYRFTPHLILIGDGSLVEQAFDVGGTDLRDSGAIVSTVMNIRSLLSNVAVSNAIDRVEALGGAEGDPHWHLVEVNPQVFGLALGWSLSWTTANMIGLSLGHPDWIAARPTEVDRACRTGSPAADAAARARCAMQIVAQNSCALSRIVAVDRASAPDARCAAP